MDDKTHDHLGAIVAAVLTLILVAVWLSGLFVINTWQLLKHQLRRLVKWSLKHV